MKPTFVSTARWTYLYRAMDSVGDTIDFLSPKRDAIKAKLFLQLALRSGAHIRPRVINVDGDQAYAHAITELKRDGEPGRQRRCRRCPYLNNVLEQDHRLIKKRNRKKRNRRESRASFD